MTESDLQARIRLALGRIKHVRLFRNNVGEAWLGKPTARSSDQITLIRPVRVVYGLCPGSSDLVGWTTITITPEMVGQQIAQFTAAEVKAPTGAIRPDQTNFVAAVSAAGGRAAIVRSVEDAIALVTP
jgi:hypothetical protein